MRTGQDSGTPRLAERHLTNTIIGAAIEVHRHLGPGLLESTYRACLEVELRERGLEVAGEVAIPVHFKGRAVDCGYRLDLLVGGRVIVELKVVERLMPLHEAQLLTYLKLTGVQVGLLLNFNVYSMRDGIRRMVLNAPT